MVTDAQGVEVTRLKAKDGQAFRVLIERLQQPIARYLYRLVGDHEAALDLTQDTFLQVFKEIGKTSPDLALDAWIYRIATNYGLQYLNRQRLRQIVRFSCYFASSDVEDISWDSGRERTQMLWPSSEGPSIEDQAEIRILIEQALSFLKPKDAACLQLHYSNGLTYEQIGKIVEITPEAARKRVARGVEKFRLIYGKMLAETPITETSNRKLRLVKHHLFSLSPDKECQRHDML